MLQVQGWGADNSHVLGFFHNLEDGMDSQWMGLKGSCSSEKAPPSFWAMDFRPSKVIKYS